MIVQTIEALNHDLDTAVRSVYLVLGPEEYQRDEALHLLKSRVLTDGAAGFDYSEFTAKNAPVPEILQAANIYPMLSKRRLVLVEDVNNFEKNREEDGDDSPKASKARKSESELDMLLEGLESISPRSTVILTAMELDKRRKLYKFFQKNFCLCEFPKLRDAELQRWAETFVRKSDHSMSSSSIRRVVEMAGSDLRTLASEFEKLMLFAGEEKNIPDSVIEDLVRTSRQQTIFNLTDAVGRRDRHGALKALDSLLGMGEHPLVVVTMLSRQCRQMLIAIEGVRQRKSPRDIASEAQIPPFKLDEFLGLARSADQSVVEKMFLRLAAMDRQLKSSSVDGRMLLEGLICEFI